MWMCGRPYPSDAGTGPSKRNLPERSVRTLPRPRGPYPFGPACQRTTRAPATGLQSVPRTCPYRTCPVPIFARRGAERPLCWKGPAPSFRVGWQAVDSPDAVRASPPATTAAIKGTRACGASRFRISPVSRAVAYLRKGTETQAYRGSHHHGRDLIADPARGERNPNDGGH